LRISIPPFNSCLFNNETKIIYRKELINKNLFLRFERATWQGKTRLLLAVRNKTGLCVDDSRKHGVSLSSMDVKLLQYKAVDDKN